jgi:hypothetical protein
MNMTKPIEKPRRQPLVHKPWDVLDSFGNYDATNRNWLEFDDCLTEQIGVLEANNARYIRPTANLIRRSSR